MFSFRTNPFQIRVAFLGHCSVGKSTTINAIVKRKVCEIAVGQTTTGFNFFPIKRAECEPATRANVDKHDHLTFKIDSKEENGKNRERGLLGNGRCFPLTVPHEIVTMHPDCQLVLIDTPGLDESINVDENGNTVKMILEEMWPNLDMVVGMIDKFQAVSKMCEVENVLTTLKELRAQNDAVKICILFNKVDDPEEDGLAEVTAIVEKKVEEILGTDDTVHFLSVSSKIAFVYMAASLWAPSRGQFCDEQYEEALVGAAKRLLAEKGSLFDELGKQEVGKSWRDLTQDKKLATVSSALTKIQQRIEATRFDEFHRLLGQHVGGQLRQDEIVKRHLELLTRGIGDRRLIARELQPILQASVKLGRDAVFLKGIFWEKFGKLKKDDFKDFAKNMNLGALTASMKELEEFSDFLCACDETGDSSLNSIDDYERVLTAMKEVCKHQIKHVVTNAKALFTQDTSTLKWKEVNSDDFVLIMESIRCAERSSTFSDIFVRDFAQFTKLMRIMPDTDKPDLKPTIKLPDSLYDDSHWGYLVHTCCRYGELLTKKKMIQ